MTDTTPSHVSLTWEKYQSMIQRLADLESALEHAEECEAQKWRGR